MLDVDGRQLVCSGLLRGDEVSLVLAVDDFSNPLAYVLNKAQSCIWHSLNGGVRVEHAAFRMLLAKLGRSVVYMLFPFRIAMARFWLCWP